MLVRKINAGLSLLITVLFLSHALIDSVLMILGVPMEKPTGLLPWILVGLMAIHMMLSINQAISGFMDDETPKSKLYFKLNRATMVQRISGILMVLFIALHVAGASNQFQPKLLYLLIHPFLVFPILAHIGISTGKALITLGIGNAKLVRVVNIVMKVVGVITFITCMTGFYLYMFMEVGK